MIAESSSHALLANLPKDRKIMATSNYCLVSNAAMVNVKPAMSKASMVKTTAAKNSSTAKLQVPAASFIGATTMQPSNSRLPEKLSQYRDIMTKKSY